MRYTNVRFVDPALYLPHGAPEFNPDCGPEPLAQYALDEGPGNTVPSYYESNIDENTVLLLNFNDNIQDFSNNPVTLTNNGATFVTKAGSLNTKVLYVNGTSSYLQSSAASKLNFGTGNFTVEARVCPEATSNRYPSFIGYGTSWTTDSKALRFDNTGYGEKFGYYHNPGDPFFVSSSTFSHDAWHHVALVRSGTSLKFYINGTLQASATIDQSKTFDFGESKTLFIGWSVWDGANGYFKGWMEEIRFSNVDRTQQSTDPLYIESGDSFTPPAVKYSASTDYSLIESGKPSGEGTPIYQKVKGVWVNTQADSDSSFLYTENDDLINSLVPARTYSINYDYADSPEGVLFATEDDSGNVVFALYIDDSQDVYLYNNVSGANQIASLSNDLSEFVKNGQRDYANFILTYTGTAFQLYINGSLKSTVTATIDVTDIERITVGDCPEFQGYTSFCKGWLKSFRIYGSVLTATQIDEVTNEFTTRLGNGTTDEYPLGAIPKTMVNDTMYILRKYDDGTTTRLDFNGTQNISKVAIVGCPDPEDNLQEFPQIVQDSSWVSEPGRAILQETGADTGFASSTLSVFELKNLDILRHETSSDYIFRNSISSLDAVLNIDNCRFSSVGNNIDNPVETAYNTSACKYILYSGEFGKASITNCSIVHVNNYDDAFKLVNGEFVYIINVNITSTSLDSSLSWNGFTFGLLKGNTSFNYDNIRDNTGNSRINNLVVENVYHKTRLSTGRSMMGTLAAVNAKRVRMNNVVHVTDDNIGTPEDSPCTLNGVLYLGGMYDYEIRNINVTIPLQSVVDLNSTVNFWAEELSTTEYSSAPNYSHLVENVSVVMSDNSSMTINSDADRTYYSTSDDYVNYYTAFSFQSTDSRGFNLPLIKDVYVRAPMSKAMAIRGANMIDGVAEGTVALLYAHAQMTSISTPHGYNAIDVWRQAHLVVDNVSVSNYNGGEVVRMKNAASTSIYIKECNVPPGNLQTGYTGTVFNNAIIYCPNTVTPNTFYLRGHGHAVVPVQYRRLDGAQAALRLCRFGTQREPFRIPPHPHQGMEKNLLVGRHKLEIFFAHAENATIEQLIARGLHVELIAPDRIYDSRIDGQWVEDSSQWSEPLLSKFRYEIVFDISEQEQSNSSSDSDSSNSDSEQEYLEEQEEKVYIRVYYNLSTNVNGGLFMDPKFEWSTEEQGD